MSEITPEQIAELRQLRAETAARGHSDGRFEERAYELMPDLLDTAERALAAEEI